MTTPTPPTALAPDDLRWHCNPADFGFETTREVAPLEGVVGQDTAVDALTFGLEINAPGQNVFVRGLSGTGRSTLIQRLMARLRPACAPAPDRCYVHNFEKADRPRLLTLPRGRGPAFRDRMEEFVRFVRQDLAGALASDVIKQRSKEMERQHRAAVEALTAPFEKELAEAGLAMVTAQAGPVTRQMILPRIDGEPAPWERVDALRQEGRLTDEEVDALKKTVEAFTERMGEIGQQIQTLQEGAGERMRGAVQDEARALLGKMQAGLLKAAGGGEATRAFLDQVVDDIVEEGLEHLGEPDAFTERYRINLIETHKADAPCPIIEDGTPSVQSLLGTIDRSMQVQDAIQAPHMLIHGGSLLRADGGYLILEAREVLSEVGAWRALVRTLRSGHIEMVAPDGPVTWRVPPLKPDPIPVTVKVVLIGNAQIYYALDAMDADFPQLFKVLADFDDVLPRDAQGLTWYAGVLSRLAQEEDLRAFHRSAVAALCEHGARIAGRAGKLTTRFGRLADLAREGAFLADKAGDAEVTGDHIRQAVRRTKERANLPSRRFQENVERGTLRIETTGAVPGQVNGLAVIQAGPLTYGFPSRITCSVGPGTEGRINVEGEAAMSGRIHNKGFAILDGLLRHLLKADHPLTFDASIAFEQSYGGIDGDSASGAEICCLLSALAEMPLRQDLAMTGAIDQRGHIQPIGAVTEKIEGFFDICRTSGLTGTQGVIIPTANAGDLMLRPDVVDAAREGRFHVYAVSRIEEALSLFLGDADRVLQAAKQRARVLYDQALPPRA